jgi:hypothetical protein
MSFIGREFKNIGLLAFLCFTFFLASIGSLMTNPSFIIHGKKYGANLSWRKTP